MMSVLVGVAVNPWSASTSVLFAEACDALGVAHRRIELAGLVVDPECTLGVTHLAPYVASGHLAFELAVRYGRDTPFVLNDVAAVAAADDKAATALLLAKAGVPSLPSLVVCDEAGMVAAAEQIGFPVVLKTGHGAMGRNVRRAGDVAAVRAVAAELLPEERLVVVQPQVLECWGRSLRVMLLDDRVVAAIEFFTAGQGAEWRSNRALGSRRREVELTGEEAELVAAGSRALGLRYAGWDLLRTDAGPRLLEVNACPGLRPGTISSHRIARAVIRQLLATGDVAGQAR